MKIGIFQAIGSIEKRSLNNGFTLSWIFMKSWSREHCHMTRNVTWTCHIKLSKWSRFMETGSTEVRYCLFKVKIEFLYRTGSNRFSNWFRKFLKQIEILRSAVKISFECPFFGVIFKTGLNQLISISTIPSDPAEKSFKNSFSAKISHWAKSIFEVKSWRKMMTQLDIGNIDVGDVYWRPNLLMTSLISTSQISRHHKVTNIIISPTSLSPLIFRHQYPKIVNDITLSQLVTHRHQFANDEK